MTREAAPALQFRDVNWTLASLPILKSVDFVVEHGAFVALVGPSGCGKTSLLNLAAGLAQPDEGSILYHGQSLTKPNTGAGYLTQDDALLPWRDVISNVGLPLEVKKVPKRERTEAARKMIAKVGLAGFEHHRPRQLSGGMRKRVSLARTLIYQPAMLLLDEPFGALDAQTRTLMQRQLLDLTTDLNLTVLLVTHDIEEAIALADKIVVLTTRPARIIEVLDVSQRDKRDVARSSADDTLFGHIWEHLAKQSKNAEES